MKFFTHISIFLVFVRVSLLCGLFLLLNGGIFAQNYLANVQHFSVDEGLSGRFTEYFYQDSMGFAWIGTRYGLNRFDGHDFKTYTKGKNQMADNMARKIHEDVNKDIWIMSYDPIVEKSMVKYGGLKITILKTANDSFTPFSTYFSSSCPFKEEDILHTYQDKNRVIWISIKGGQVYQFDGAFKKVYDNGGVKNFVILFSKSSDRSWCLTENILTEIDEEGNIYERDSIPGIIESLKPDTKDGLWIVQKTFVGRDNQTEYHLWRKLPGVPIQLFDFTIKGTSNNVLHNRSICYAVDQKDQVWYFSATKKILLILDDQGNLIEDLSNLYQEKINPGIGNYNLFFDRQDNAWMVTNEGIYLINVYKTHFKKYLNNEYFSIRGMTEVDSNKLYINTYKGVKVLDLNTNEIESVKGLEKHYSLGLLKTQNGNVISGTYIPEVFIYNPIEKEIKKYLQIKYRSKSFNSFYYNEVQQKYLIGTSNGIEELALNGDKVIPFTSYNQFEELKKCYVHFFYKDKKENKIWITTNDGLYLLDPQYGIVEKYNSFPYNDIVHMYQDEDGIYWLATLGGGLIRWDKTNNKKDQFTTDNGLSHDVIYAVYEDELGYLWIPSNKGIMRFHKESESINTYLLEDGLSHDEFNRHAHYQTLDGQLIFGGLNGIVAFYPNKIHDLSLAATGTIQILDLKILDGHSGELIDHTTEVIEKNQIELYPENKSFILKFALLDLTHTGTKRYAYRIDKLEKDWTFLESNSLRINQLPYGDYTLEIRGEGRYGLSLKQQLSIPLVVKRPFTKTIIFYLILICGLGILVWGYFKFRLFQLEKANLKLEEEVRKRTEKIEKDRKIISHQYNEVEKLNQTKDRLFAIIAHDLRDYVSSFTGVEKKINFLIENGQLERIPQLTSYIEDAASDLNLLLDNLLNWALQQKDGIPYHPDKIKLKKLSQNATQTLYKFAQEKEITILNEIPDDLTAYADNRALATIIRNLVHNAIKFTSRGGMIRLHTKVENDKVQVCVEDSGVGIPTEMMSDLFKLNSNRVSIGTENEQGTGLGLMLCKELAEVQNGKINVSSQPGEGTIFTITLPAVQQAA